MNGLDVNRATYEEVIGLIKRTPRCSDISLKVTNLGKIPFQEKSGDSIKWLQVTDLPCEPAAEEENDDRFDDQATTEPLNDGLDRLRNAGKQLDTVKGSSLSSSDEGIESCESQRGANSLSGGESETDSRQAERRHSQQESHSVTIYHHQKQHHQVHETISANRSTSLTFSSTSEDTCSSSSCSLSISSASSSLPSSSQDEAEEEPIKYKQSGQQTLVRVPGGRQTSEPFGCGVVKGPDEWPGIFVQNVKPASLAERVGLEPGDQLVRADGHCLASLSFEAAIQLIKRLQQEQDELQLQVRKGAALKHLAASNKQQRLAQAAASTNPPQTRSREEPPSSLPPTMLGLVERRPAWKLAPADAAQRQPADEQLPSPECRIQQAQRQAKPRTSEASPPSPSSRASIPAEQLTGGQSRNSTERPPATSGAYQSASGSLSRLPDAGESVNGNPISGTKTQLSGKRDQHDNSNDNKRFDYEQDDDDDDDHCSHGAAYKLENENGKQLLHSANRFRQATQTTADENSQKFGLTNQLERGGKLEEAHFIQKAPIDRQQVNRVGAATECATSTSCQSKTAAAPQRHQQQADDDNINDQTKRAKSNRRSQSKDELDLNGNHISEELEEKRCCGVLHDEHQVPPEAGKMMPTERHQDHRRNQQRTNVGQDDKQEEEEIRIVRQNCKLHQAALHQFKSSCHVHEKFPHPAAKLQMQLQQRQLAKKEAVRKGLARLRRPQMGGSDSSASSNLRQRPPEPQVRPMLHRYVSMDNLSMVSAQPVAGCPASLAAKQHLQLQRSLCRGSSSRRDDCQIDKELYANGIHYDRAGLFPGSLEGSECSMSSAPPTKPQRIYRRSNSVLMQQCACCLKLNASQQVKGLECPANSLNYNLAPADQCCAQRRSSHQQQQLAYSSKRYCSTLGSSMALSRAKAQSMDKLNMNISLNYVKIGLNSPYRQMKQQMVPLNAGALKNGFGPGAHKQQQRLNSNQRLQLAADSCCSARQVALQQQQAIYNYATAARMISSGDATAPARQARQKTPLEYCNGQLDCKSAPYHRVQHCQGSPCTKETSRCCTSAYKLTDGLTCPATQCSKPTRFDDYSGGDDNCCNSALACCCLSAKLPDLARAVDQRRTNFKSSLKPSAMGSVSDVGAVTDSSGYLSGPLIKAGGGSDGDQCVYSSRLLKLCTGAPQPPPPPPPMPPMLVTTAGKHVAQVSGQRDTRQRLSTFLSPSNPSSSSLDSCSPRANSSLLTGNGRGRPQLRQQSSVDASPTSCSSSYSPCSLISITATSDSSLTGSSVSGATSTSDSAAGGRKPNTSGRPILIGHHQKLGSPTAGAEDGQANGHPPQRHSVPRPPPLPAPDIEFDCKIKRILKQELRSTARKPMAAGFKMDHRLGCNKQQVDNDDDDEQDESGQEATGIRESEGKQNRLCFVDELKMLAKRQQSSTTTANLPIDSSATLIKIINASKSATVRKECNCKPTPNGQRDGCQLERAAKARPTSNRLSDSEGGCQQHPQRKCVSKSASHNNKLAAHHESKSVKLDDEDNKRHLHGKYKLIILMVAINAVFPARASFSGGRARVRVGVVVLPSSLVGRTGTKRCRCQSARIPYYLARPTERGTKHESCGLLRLMRTWLLAGQQQLAWRAADKKAHKSLHD